MTDYNLTPASLALFLAYAKDAANWSGTPLVGVDGNVSGSAEAARAERGNLTQLKRAGLITTFRDRGDEFIDFTEEGCAFARSHGIM